MARSLSFGADIDSDVSVSFQISPGGTTGYNLTFDTDAVGGNATVTVAAGAMGNITLGNGGLGGTNLNPILADNLVVDHNGSGLLLFNRPFQAAAFGITKNGTGTMQTNNNNLLTGPLTINTGRLIANTFGTSGDVGNFSSVNLNGGTLQVNHNSETTGSNPTQKSYTNPFNVTAASTIAFFNSTSGSEALVLSGSALDLDAALTMQNISTDTALNNFMTIDRNITGTEDLIVDGYNNVASAGDNLSLGRVSLNGDNSGWSGDLVVREGTASFGGDVTLSSGGTGDIILGETANAFGVGLVFQATAPPTVSGPRNVDNGIIVRSGGFRLIKGYSDHTYNFNGNILLEGDLNVESALFFTDKRLIFNGDISGTGGINFTKSGGDFVRLTGNNTYSGATTIGTGAELNINSATGTAIGDSSAVSFAGAGAALIFNSTNETVGSIASSGTDGEINLGANTLTTGGNNASTSFGGAISGSSTSGLTKVGNGTFTLTGINTLTGAINVEAGTLVAGRAGNADIGTTSAVNLNGGNLVFQPGAGFDKTYSGGINVNSAGTLSYDNTNNTTHTLTLDGVNPLNLSADLTVKNISDDDTLVNGINISRSITGAGDMIVKTYNNIDANTDDFRLGRIQLSGDNSGWSGDLSISEGTVTLSGATANNTGTGTIVIGETGNTLGAGLAFNTNTSLIYPNDITVNTGGFRAIRGNNFNSSNITFSGPVTLNGDLTVDHSRSITDRRIALSGAITGNGGLTITRAEGNAGTSALLSGTGKTYTGDTTVTNGASLSVTTSLTSDISVATGARIGGNGGSTTGSLTLAAGANFIFYQPTFATFNVSGSVTLDNSFGVASLVGGSQGEVVPWATIPAGAYTLIGTATNTFSGIQNFGVGNAATGLGGGRSAYFQYAGGGLQLVVTVSASGFDAWKAANGNPSGGLGDDHDGDGVDNGTEYFLFGNTSSTGFTTLPGVINNAGVLSVTWTKATTGYDGAYNTDFVVETSDTLTGWTSVTPPTVIDPQPAGTVKITGNEVKYIFPATGTKNFARLKVTGPN